MRAGIAVAAAVVLCLLLTAAGSFAAQGKTATAAVKNMLDEVLAVQNDPKLQGQEFRSQRRALIKKIIARDFYFDDMARQSLGKQWEKLNAGQKTEFKNLFQDLFLDSYTKLVLDFLKKEKIVYGEEEDKGGESLVRTTIERANEKIPVDYSLVPVQGRWLVRDVAIDNVSIVRNYERSFARTIQRESYKSLLQKMRQQQEAIKKSSGSAAKPR